MEVTYGGRNQIGAARRDARGRCTHRETSRDPGFDSDVDRKVAPIREHDDVAELQEFCLPGRRGEQHVGEPELASCPGYPSRDVHPIGLAGDEARALGIPVYLVLLSGGIDRDRR